jgi:NAD(P)-dependent dehydrogenase (short-subunit alcohol dehydrogenase family)
MSDASRVLLITGGSRGIGAATARHAAERGYAVCVNYRTRAEAAHRVIEQLHSQGARATAVQADVSVEEDVVRLFETCDRELGPLYGLVNNAAILERQRRMETFDAARLHRIFATNVIGAFLCVREAVRRMSTKHGGACAGAERSGAAIPRKTRACRLSNLIGRRRRFGRLAFPRRNRPDQRHAAHEDGSRHGSELHFRVVERCGWQRPRGRLRKDRRRALDRDRSCACARPCVACRRSTAAQAARS